MSSRAPPCIQAALQLAIALKKVKGDRVKGKEKVRASFTWSDVWRLVGNRSFLPD